jgi:L-methionine (R)-S-oxide reductase
MTASISGWAPLRGLPRGSAGLQRAAEVIRAASPHHTSVYLYALEGETLVLRAFSGRPTDRTRIAVGEGVCGRAVATGSAQVVADVGEDPDYISCSVETRAECVVLVRRDGAVVGQIDIDSDVTRAFTGGDLESLEAAAALIAPAF